MHLYIAILYIRYIYVHLYITVLYIRYILEGGNFHGEGTKTEINREDKKQGL